MQHLVTVIIATHNKHNKLDRLLEYYHGTTFPIIIADSSNEKHKFRQLAIHWTYSYMPRVHFSGKLEAALTLVRTPFVVICPDNQFVLQDGIQAAGDFLSKHAEYTTAQGYSIGYGEETPDTDRIRFHQLDSAAFFDISMDDPIGRLEKRFSEYKSVLFAVHRTSSLRLAFRNAGFLVKDSSLTELLAAVVPLVSGKYKALSVLYQICEPHPGNTTAADSESRFPCNIDQLNALINLVTYNLSGSTGLNKEILKDRITDVLYKLAGAENQKDDLEIVDDKGNHLLDQFRILSKNVVQFKRKTEADFHCKKLIRNAEHSSDMIKVTDIIRKYAAKETIVRELQGL